jgi:hypothetical protein
MSFKPLICTRPGTVALIPTVPVEVAPTEPCVAANDVVGIASVQQASSTLPLRNPRIGITPPVTISVSDVMAMGC